MGTSGGVAEPDLAEVRTCSRCFIGPNVVISRGVTIGDGCITGANSFVNMSIPANTKAGATPARCIGPVDG